jgi:hypothetical protein
MSDPTFYKVGKFWKNSVLTDLPGGAKSTQLMQSAMWNGDLYIAGTEIGTANGISAFCFKNNEQMLYTDGVNSSGTVNRILLAPK